MNQDSPCKYIKSIDYQTDKSRTLENLTLFIELILLSLMSMDFRTRFFYFAFALFGVLIIFQRMKFETPLAVIPAIILSVSMCLFSPTTRGWTLGMIRPFAYPLCVIAGYNLVNVAEKKKAERQIVYIIIALAFGACTHYVLNMIINWGKSVDRNTIDYWTKSVLAATGQSALASLMIGVAIPLLFTEIKKRYKFLALGILVCILYYNLVLGGRTIFVLFFAMLFINILSSIIRSKSGIKRIRILFILFIIAVFIFVLIRFNIFGINDLFVKSNFYKRFFAANHDNVTEDGRSEYRILYLKNMFFYLFGGNELRRAVGNHYAHDLLLDLYSDSGFFAFVAVLFMLGFCLIKTFKLFRDPQTGSIFKRILVNVIITFFTMFAMEPILDGMPWMFASFCIIFGSITRIMELNALQNNKENNNMKRGKLCGLLK